MARARQQPPVPFDPYQVFQALDRHHVQYVVIGAFARVIHGTRETTHAIDITPSMRADNQRRLAQALADLDARPTGDDPADADAPRAYATRAGALTIVATPAGTRGYDDLRRQATRENIGQSCRPQVATPGDLARMLGALDDPTNQERLLRLRRLIELDRSRGLTLEP